MRVMNTNYPFLVVNHGGSHTLLTIVGIARYAVNNRNWVYRRPKGLSLQNGQALIFLIDF